MNKNLKLSVGLIALAAAAVLAVAIMGGDDDVPAATDENRDELLVRSDSPRLSEGAEATFVEFLDFECEGCGALYPTIEDLRETYGDRVSFVVRYMPLHTSSVNAARAAEAARLQGEFEAMYDLLFQRQADWGHQDTPQEAAFFEYAEELGLDMDQFRSDYDDPATLARIEQSERDGRALGVTATPTMFIDGERLEPETLDELIAAFDAAVAD